MGHKSGSFQTKDNLNIYTQSFEVNQAKASLIFVHGYTEHSGRYQWMSEVLNRSGTQCYTFDLRGHGKSEGIRAHIDYFDQYVEDLHMFLSQLPQSNLPMFIMGHSMGSLIAAKYLMQYENLNIRGFISSAGALKIDDDLSPFIRKISGILSALMPKLKTVKLNPELMSRIPASVKNYKEDPLVYHEGTKARLGYEVLQNMKYVQNNFHRFNFASLILHGTGDKITDPQGSQWMFEKIKTEDKTLKIFPGVYHELMMEPEREEILNICIDWISQRT